MRVGTSWAGAEAGVGNDADAGGPKNAVEFSDLALRRVSSRTGSFRESGRRWRSDNVDTCVENESLCSSKWEFIRGPVMVDDR